MATNHKDFSGPQTRLSQELHAQRQLIYQQAFLTRCLCSDGTRQYMAHAPLSKKAVLPGVLPILLVHAIIELKPAASYERSDKGQIAVWDGRFAHTCTCNYMHAHIPLLYFAF